MHVDLRAVDRRRLRHGGRGGRAHCRVVDGRRRQRIAAAQRRPSADGEDRTPRRGWWRWPSAIAGELGFALRDAATGGASDANTTAALGVPTLDGLGPIGGDDHSVDEWLDLTSVVPRTTLLAALIGRIGEAL